MKVQKWVLFVIAIALICAGISTRALADEPVFRQRDYVHYPDSGQVELAALYGDGIIMSPPVQVVAYDQHGVLLAATPIATHYLILCTGDGEERECRIYDEVDGLVFEPDFALWNATRTIAINGRPTEYPEYMDVEYGFKQRDATFGEKVRFLILGISITPINSLLSVLWWTVICSAFTRLLWRWKRNNWLLEPAKFQGVFLSLLWLCLSGGMIYITVGMWNFFPTPVIYVSFVFLMGLLLAIVITRPRVKK